MPLLALLLALLCIAAGGCGGGGGKGQIDLEDYGRALAALREAEGDGRLHAAASTAATSASTWSARARRPASAGP